MIPQFILIAFTLYGLSVHAIKHGKERVVTQDFYKNMFGFIIEIVCLIAGGFFASWGVPQIIFIILAILAVIGSIASHEEKEYTEYNFFKSFFLSALAYGLWYWGGFFDVFVT